jgi:hypothetical protein
MTPRRQTASVFLLPDWYGGDRQHQRRNMTISCLLLLVGIFQQILDECGNDQNDDDPDGNTH